jgi:CheY-like chemotaxis protein
MPESSLRQRNWLLRLGVALMVLTLPAGNHPLARLAHYLSGVLTVFGGGLMAFGENLSPSMGWAGVWVAFFGFLGLFIPSTIKYIFEERTKRRDEDREDKRRNMQGQLDWLNAENERLRRASEIIHSRVSSIEDTAVVAATVAAANKTDIAGVTGQLDAVTGQLDTVTKKLQEIGWLRPTGQAPPGKRGPRPTVLVVEDEEGAMEFLARFFILRGYAVTQAPTVAKALVAIEKDPHWVVLDLHVAGEDGLEVLRKIKTDGRQTKVVIITGIDDPEKLEEARKLGACGLFVKPIDEKELFALMGQEQGG